MWRGRTWVAMAVVVSALCAGHAQAQLSASPPDASAPGDLPPVDPSAPPSAQPPSDYAPPPYGPPADWEPMPYPEHVPRTARRPLNGLLIAGITVFSVSYLGGVISGAIVLSTKCATCNDVGKLLFIPFAGPFLAMPDTSFPFDYPLALLGIFQLGTAALLTAAIVGYVKSKRRIEREPYALELRGGRRLAFDVHASPLKTGPALTLRF